MVVADPRIDPLSPMTSTMFRRSAVAAVVGTILAVVMVRAAPVPEQPEFVGPKTAAELWMHGFVSSLSMILVSEIGDKTFFIAAVMAMRQPRLVVYAGALSALALMTVLSVALGYSLQAVPVVYTWGTSILLFLVFGVKMAWDASTMAPDEGMEELEEVATEIEESENTLPGVEVNVSMASNITWALRSIVGVVFAQAFTMTFLAEWGDRSQIATIALGASTNPYAVTVGGIIGHGICTMAAVLGGRMLAQRISVRHVTMLGAVVFVIFALHSLVVPPEGVNGPFSTTDETNGDS